MALTHEYNLPDLDDKISSNDGTNSGADLFKELDLSKVREGYDFVSANSDSIDFGDAGNVKSIVMIINLDSTSQSFLQNNVNGVSASSGTLSYTDFDNAFVDGVDTNTITTGWHCVIITSTTDVACSNLELGHIGATYGNFKCAYVATYSEDLSVAQVQRITEEQLFKVNSRDSAATYRYLPPKNSIRDGLVNEYYLDSPDGTNTVKDYKLTHDGTKAGTTKPTTAVASNGMNYLNFGTAHGATLGSHERVDLTLADFSYAYNSAFTINVWFRRNGDVANTETIFAVSALNTDIGIFIDLTSADVLRFSVYQATAKCRLFSTTPTYIDNKWHMATLVFSSNTLTCYVDGKLAVGSATNTGTPDGSFYDANCKALIGTKWSQTNSNYQYDFGGDVAVVQNWNVAKTATEIDKLYRDTYIN